MSFARSFRRQMKRRSEAAAKRQRKVFFEPLEPRILLSSDPLSYTAAAGAAMDITLRLQDVEGIDTLQLIDNNGTPGTEVVASQALSATSAVNIIGSDQDDKLTIDFSTPFSVPDGILFSDAFSGDNDTLKVIGANNTWTINGADAGNVAGVEFNGIENLTGAEDNEDTFVFNATGSIRGLVDGGSGGYDSLELAGGQFDMVTYTVSGPDSGTIDRDGNLITFVGLEPVTDDTPGDKTFNGSSGADTITISGSGLSITVADTYPGTDFEAITYTDPGNITINAGGGTDQITIQSLDTYAYTLTVNGGAGDDTYFFDNSEGSVGTVNIIDISGTDELDFSSFADTFDSFTNTLATSLDGSSITFPVSAIENLTRGVNTHIQLSSTAVDNFLAGLENLTIWAEKFADYGDFAKELPGIAGNVSITVENALDIAGAIDQLRIKILNYLEGLTDPITTENLVEAIEAVTSTAIERLDRAIVGDLVPDFSGSSGTFNFQVELDYIDSATDELVSKTEDLYVTYAGNIDDLVTNINIAITANEDLQGKLSAVVTEGRVAIQSTVSGFKELAVRSLNTNAETILGFSSTLKSILAGGLEGLGELDIGVPGVALSFDFEGGYPQLKLDFNYEAERINSFNIDLGKDASDVGIQFDVDAKLDVESNLAADLNLYLSLDPTPEFSVDLNSLNADLAVSGAVNADLKVGFLEANANGTINLLADIDVAFENGSGISSSALSTISIDALTPGIVTNSDFALNFDISVTPSLNGFADPATLPNVLISVSDIFAEVDRDVDIAFSNFDELFNFDNINAAAVAGLLGQLAGWLDGLSSNRLGGLEIPFTNKTVADILDFQDLLSDKLLFNDGDSSITAKKKIVNDLNSALNAAGIGDQLRAEGDGLKLKLVVTDPEVTSFSITVSGSSWLGFGTQSSVSGVITALSNATLPDLDAEPPQTPGDAVLNISINSEASTEVRVSESSLLDNLAVGYNIPMLLNFDNSPTFTSAQEFADRLAVVLGVSDVLSYDSVDMTIAFELDLTGTLFDESVPLNFNLDLSPIVDLSTVADINLVANGGLTLTVGIDLDQTGTDLTTNSLLTDVNGGDGVDIKTNASYMTEADVAETSWRLSDDAHFDLTVGSTTYKITVEKTSTFDNEEIADLVADINAQLPGSVSASSNYDSDTGKYTLILTGSEAFSLTATPSDPAVRELGFGAAQNSDGNIITAQNDLRTTYGRFGTDISFDVSIDGGDAQTITLTGVDSDGTIGIDSSTNSTVIDLVSDINKALRKTEIGLQNLDDDGKIDKATSSLWAEFVGNRILFTAGDSVTSFTIDAVDSVSTVDDAVDMLGLTNGSRASDNYDFVINTHDGTSHKIFLDGATDIGHIIEKITEQTGGADYTLDRTDPTVIAGLSFGAVEVAFNNDHSGLRLIDTTSGSEKFAVLPMNGSKAAYGLGIVGIEGLEDTNNDSVVDAEDGYGIINGAQIAGVTFADRFYVENAVVSGDLAISTPGGVSASALFGDFVGISLDGDGSFSANVEAGLKNPDSGEVGGRVTLAQLLRGVDDISSVVQAPAFTGGGSLEFDVSLTPDITSLIPLGSDPRVVINIDNPFAASVVTDSPSSFDLGASSFDIKLDVPDHGTHIIEVELAEEATWAEMTASEFADALNAAIQAGFEAELGEGATSYIQAEILETGGVALRILEGEHIDSFTIANATGGAASILGFDSNDFGALTNLVSDFVPDLDFDFPDLGDLLKFETPSFNFDSIMAALIQLSDFLQQFEEFDFLNEDLPLLDMSVNDVLDFTDRLNGAINEALANPAGTIQFLEEKLEEALGTDTIGLSLDSYDFGEGAVDLLKLEVDLTVGFVENANFSIPEIDIPVLEEVFDLGGSANLGVSGNLALDLDFAIDLNNPLENIYVYNTTGLSGDLSASATGIDFRAALGPMGLFIKDGSAAISGNIFAGFASGSDTLVELTDFSTLSSSLTVNVDGDIDINLPTYFPTEFSSIGAFDFDVESLDWDSLTPEALLSHLTLPDFSSIDLSSIGLFDSIILAVDGIDLFLEGLQDVLDGEVFGLKIPFIGDKLSAGSGFIQDFRQDFVDPFREFVAETQDASRNFTDPHENIVSNLLFDLLGDPSETGETFSLNILKHLPVDAANPDNPDGSPYGPEDYIKLETDGENYIQWYFSIGDTYGAGTEIDLDLGIPGLGIEAEGDVGIEFEWDLDFGFGLSLDDGFYIDVSDENELFFNVGVTLPHTFVGKLGFLQLRAEDSEVYDAHSGTTNVDLAFAVDINNGSDLSDDRLGLSEFGQINFDAGIAAEAVAELMLYLEVNKGDLGLDDSIAAGIPKLQSAFILDWSIGSYVADNSSTSNVNETESSTFVDVTEIGNSIKDGLKLVEFQDVSLDVGSFLSDVLGPIVGEVKSITEPLQPLIDVMTTPIPVLSDLGPPITLLDIAAAYGKIDPGMIYSIADIISLINRIPDPDEVGALLINFGDFTVFDNRDTPGPDGKILSELWNPGLQTSGDNGLFNDLKGNLGDLDFDSLLAGGADGTSKSTMTDLTSGNAGGGFAFPIFDDPSQVFGLLMGEPAVLITYDMAPLYFEFEWSQFFSIWGPLGVSVNIEFAADIDFAFGYDTLGIQRFIESDFNNPATLLDGFYISDTDLPTGEFGVDVPEIVLTGGLWAAVELNLGVARAGVGGGIFAEIEFDLFDPDRDGRVRISELIMNFENQLKAPNDAEKLLAPLAVFDVNGEITAELFAFLKIDLLFWEVDKKFPITPKITLLEFDIDFYRPPVLATELENGDLVLNMGRFAKDRMLGNTTDGNEHFIVRNAGAGYVEVMSPVLADAEWQKYKINGKIIAYGDEGNDTIDLSLVTNAGDYLIEGGVGNDTITLNAAATDAVIYGGDGIDTITSGKGNDIIYGGRGADTIDAGEGNDIVFGDLGEITENNAAALLKFDDGNDHITGGKGNDYLFGGGGNDTIEGSEGDDVIFGDNGRINLNDEEVIDTNRGLIFGNDILFGNADNDRIYGGKGADIIDGGSGTDTLYGEDGDDTIYGGGDNDTIYGLRGNDTIYGHRDPAAASGEYDSTDANSDGDDAIYGNEGDDFIHGNDGADTIYGNSGADEIYGDAGDDEIFGGTEADLIYGGDDADTIDGGADSDIIYGDNAANLTGTGSADHNANVFGLNLPDDVVLGTTLSDYELGKGPEDPGYGDAANIFGDTIYGGIGSDFIDGQVGNDTYIINLQGADKYSFINVHDTGSDANDIDYMQVFGTMYDDDFLLRKSTSAAGLAFVALLNDEPNAERVNYWQLERMLVTGSFGDDHFAVDDTGTDTTITGDSGEDTFQVGQLYQSPRGECATAYNNIEPEDYFATIETTVGWLSDGINKPMTIYGGDNNDYFTVFHNKAVLSLFGEDGDDTFFIKAFAMAGSQEPIRERTDVSGGAGVDLIQYAVNAPVNIDGGDGFDRVIIIGTEFGDDIVVTKDGVYGAGLNVNFVNIESLSVDGAEGDDRFYVQSTGENLITEIFGGLGSDTFNMSGDIPPVISNDLKGHSGLIYHEIENTGTNYDETTIAGISANIFDNDTADPVVVISDPDGSTVITEGGMTDYYFIRLSKAPAPGETVTVMVMAPVQTQDQKEREAKLFQLFSPDEVNHNSDRTTITLEFDEFNWAADQKVEVSAPNDDTIEGDKTGFITHMVNSEVGIEGSPESVNITGMFEDTLTTFVDNDATFSSNLEGYMVLITDGPGAGQSLRIKDVVDSHTLTLFGEFRTCVAEGETVDWTTSEYKITRDIEAVRTIEVLVHDNDKAGVVIDQTDHSTEIFEGGDSDTINVVLNRKPTADVTVTLTSNDGQLTFDTSELIFTDTTWSTPQPVTVSAFDDDTAPVREGFHHGLISFTVSSGDVDTLVAVTSSAPETFDLTSPEAYVALKNQPATGEPIVVKVDGEVRDASLYDVVSNKVVFLLPSGDYEPIKGVVEVTYSYTVVGYDGIGVKPVLTNIADDEVAQVKITQTGSSTDVVEGETIADTYEVVLTQAPTGGDVKVKVTPEDTKTSAGRVIHWGTQVAVTFDPATAPGAVANGDGTITLTFSSDSGADNYWKNPQTVNVVAIDDDFYDGDDTQVFAPQLHTISDIQGPLYLQGAGGQGSIVSFEPLMLHYELNIMPPTDVVDSVSGDGTQITVDKAKLIEGAEEINRAVYEAADDAEALAAMVSEMMTITIAEGLLDPELPVEDTEYIKEIGQFRLITGAVDNGNDTVTLTLNEAWDLAEDETYGMITKYRITHMSKNFFANEVEQVDYLFVYNGDSPADNQIASREGLLTDSTTIDDEGNRKYKGNSIVENFAANLDGKWLSGFGMASEDLLLGGYLHPRGITYGDMEVVEINLGDGIDEFTIEDTHSRADGFQTWTIINTGGGDDVITVDLDSVPVLLDGTLAGTISGASNTLTGDFSAFADNELAGRIIEIISGAGEGTMREIVANTASELTVSSSWNSELDNTTDYRIYGEQDGSVSINVQGGDDRVFASGEYYDEVRNVIVEFESTIPLVIFGGEGDDEIVGGSANDIIFGDRGRVEYVNEDGKIITLLGLAREKIDPEYVTAATASTLTDNTSAFPVESIDQPGLIGLMVSITDGAGFRQDPRLITGNTSDTLTVYPIWETALNPDPGGDFDPGDPDNNPSKYRISLIPEDQTDGVVRDPSLVIAIDESIGGNDIIAGSAGNDQIFGGLGDDTINGNADNDIIFGDHGRLDYTPEAVDTVEDGPAMGDFVPATLDRVRTTFDDIGGADTIYGDEGDDIILGGYNPGGTDQEDNLYGNTDNDIIIGDNGLVDFSPNATTLNDPRDVFLYSIETIAYDDGGDDIIYGNEANDIIFGGDEDDTIDAGEGNNIVLGDNGLIDYVRAESDPGLPGADWNPGDIDLILSTATTFAGGADTIDSGDGQDIIIGGRFGDIVNAGNGDNIVIGDSGRITAANANAPQFDYQPMTFGLIETIEFDDGGNDTITTGTGYDIVLGGDASDTIDVGQGENIVLGDNGLIDYVRAERDPAETPGADLNPGDIDLIESTATDFAGGIDTIDSGDGQDIIIGGRYGDTVNAGNGDNLVIGDSGRITAADADDPQFAGQPMTFGLIETIEPDDGGDDTINTGTGYDIVFGGDEEDTIDVGEGENIVFGDNGLIDYVRKEREPTADGADLNPGDIDLILSTATTFAGGIDDITSGDGQDIIIAGRFDDTVNANDGDNLVIGDSGRITAADADDPQFEGQPMTFGLIETIEFDDGGDDTITTLSGYDVVFGGDDNDTIDVGQGDNIVLGDNGLVDYVRAEREPGVPGADFDPNDIDLILSTATTIAGGIDTIDSGDGQDIVIGGRYGDNIEARNGDNLVFGDSGRITAADANVPHFAGQPITLGRVETIEDTDGGQDTILTLTGYDIVLGGHDDDTITVSLIPDPENQAASAPDSGNIVFGDTGYIDWDDDLLLDATNATNPDDIDEIKSTTTIATWGVNANLEEVIIDVGGADTIESGDGDDIIIGGRMGDTIRGRNGDNIVFGDSGHILAATIDSLVGQEHFDGQPITLGRVETIEDTDGGSDTIVTLTGYDIVLGGHDGDNIRTSLIESFDDPASDAEEIEGAQDNNIVFGDTGYIDYDDDNLLPDEPNLTGDTADYTVEPADNATNPNDIDEIVSTTTSPPNETQRLLFSGATEGVVGLSLDGSSVSVNYDITAEQLQNELQGIVDSTITVTVASISQNDFEITFEGPYNDPTVTSPNVPQLVFTNNTDGVVSLATIVDGDVGGADIINTGDGDDIIIGGRFADTIYGRDGDNVVIGDSGRILGAKIDALPDVDVVQNLAGQLMAFGLITTIEPADGGDDIIQTGDNNDIILGGFANDDIYAGKDDDWIIGDNGYLQYDRASDDILEYGLRRPDVRAHLGDLLDLDDGTIIDLDGPDNPDPRTLDLVTTTQPTLGGDDFIRGNAGNDIIFGGTGSDTIWADNEPDSVINPVNTSGEDEDDNDGDDLVFGDHGRVYPSIDDQNIDDEFLGVDIGVVENPFFDVFFINNNFFSINTQDVDGANTDADPDIDPDPDKNRGEPGNINDFEDTIFGSAGHDTIIGGQDDDILFGGEDNDILIGGHNVLGGHDELDAMDQALQDAILPSELDDLNASDINDVNDIMDGDGDEDVMAGDNAIIIRQNGFTTSFLLNSESLRYQELDGAEIYSMDSQTLGGLYDIDVGFSSNIEGTPQSEPESVVGYNVILLDHSEGIATTAAHSPADPRVFGNDIMAGGSDNDEMFGQLGDDIMQGDGSVDISPSYTNTFNPSPANVPSFVIPGVSFNEESIGFTVVEATSDGDDYMEGNGGNDRMYGNLGQDDMIGGSSSLFGLAEAIASTITDGELGGIDNEVQQITLLNAPFYGGNNGETVRTYQLAFGGEITGTIEFGADASVVKLAIESLSTIDDVDVSLNEAGDTYTITFIGNLFIGNIDELTVVTDLRPDGADMIYGGAGDTTRLARNDYVGSSDTGPAGDDLLVPDFNRHARDADVIMGDNANIFRLVGWQDYDGDEITEYGYLQFAYDQDSPYEERGDLRIVPRAVELLDYGYTYTDPNNDPISLSFSGTGAGDLIYGGSGDDIIHGMTGDDVIFGNSEDDDLYGEAGSDWISGGTGEDGILGDDGLIKTSRNDLVAEPLYSIDALNPEQTLIKKNDPVDTNALNAEISTPGNIQRAVINVEGTLKKTVDLLAFDAGLADVGVNDIIYGGLNDDSIHAGAGDDAVSGAEALPVFYTAGEVDVDGQGTLVEINELLQIQQDAPINDDPALADNPFWFDFAPYNPGDILRYEGNTASDADDPHGKSNQEFALYDEFFPRRKIMLDANGEAVDHSDDSVYDFLLNFDETEGQLGYEFLGDDVAMETDGDDKIFGDLGNDWIVGGTGRDHMYGGRGDDLLNMDDNLNSGSGGKVGPHDPPPDELLDNTQSDEYHAYADIAYGGAGRDVLILNTGADRAIDWVGEYNSYIVPFSPFGAFHISRTLQPQLPEFLYDLSANDGIDTTVPDGARYVEQKGLDVRIDPPDPLCQGEPYGELGMVRQMDFDWHNQTGAPNDPQPGNLQGKREIMRRELFQDTVAPKGAFAETEGIWSVNDGKLEAAPVMLGEDAVSIYHLDQMQPSYMEALVTINADKDKAGFKSNAYIIYDYKSPTDFKFAGVDVGIDKIQIGHYTADGWIVDTQTPMRLKANTDYDLTLVMYGTVATLWVDETVSLNFDFSDPLYDFGMIGLATKNAVARFDDWQVQKLPPTLTFQFTEDFAEASTNPFEEQMGDWMITDGHYGGTVVEVEGDRAITTWAIEVVTWSLLEFEAYIDTETTGGLIFDYYDVDNFKFAAIDAIADQVVIGHHTSKGWFIDASADASIETGTSYNLGISMLGTSVSVTLNDQAAVGHVFNSLLTDGFIGLLSKDGATLFDDVVVQGDDPAYAENLTAAAAPDVFIEPDSFLTYDALDAIVDEAIERWADALGIDDALVASLHEVSFRIVDFSDLTLGRAFEDTILIDADAAGYGWFVDTTPADDVEFGLQVSDMELMAVESSVAFGNMDLLTVVMHELGHVLGLEDLDPDTHDLMSETLDAGVRRLADDHINADSVEVNEADDLASLVVMDAAINEAEAIAPAPAAVAKHGSSWLTEFLINGTGKRYNKFDPQDDIIVAFDDDEEDN